MSCFEENFPELKYLEHYAPFIVENENFLEKGKVPVYTPKQILKHCLSKERVKAVFNNLYPDCECAEHKGYKCLRCCFLQELGLKE